MRLAIDVGNSSVKTGLFQDAHLAESFVDNGNQRIAEVIDQGKVQSAILASVRRELPGWVEGLKEAEVPFLILDNRISLPFRSNYTTPETLGSDRMASAAYAVTYYQGQDVLVIDAGTCVTFDFIDQAGVYHGGSISPGIDMRLKALNRFTGRLPLVESVESAELVGNSTSSSILSGVLNGTVAEIDGIISEYLQTYPTLNVVLTGGDAGLIEPKLKTQIFALPDLVLYGLHSILKHNEDSL